LRFISEGVVAIIEGAVDSHDGGNALFPECLKDDLHGVRATIEAYSRSARLAGRETASACGYDIRKSSANCVLQSFSKGSWSTYSIDRWLGREDAMTVYVDDVPGGELTRDDEAVEYRQIGSNV
jgi:hypothetical protein